MSERYRKPWFLMSIAVFGSMPGSNNDIPEVSRAASSTRDSSLAARLGSSCLHSMRHEDVPRKNVRLAVGRWFSALLNIAVRPDLERFSNFLRKAWVAFSCFASRASFLKVMASSSLTSSLRSSSRATVLVTVQKVLTRSVFTLMHLPC